MASRARAAPPGVGLEAVEVAADTAPGVAADLHVPDVAGAAVDPAVEVAVDDHAAADAGPDLDEEEVAGVAGHAGVPLAHRHHVDVVVEHRRAAELARERVAHRVAVPAGHQWRGHRHAAPEVDRAGHGDTHAHGVLDAEVSQESSHRLQCDTEHRVGATADVARHVLGGQDRQAAVGDPHHEAGGPDGDPDEPDVGGQVDHRRTASAARDGGPGLVGQPDLGQPAHLGADRGPRHRKTLPELGTRQRAVVAELGEHPGLHRGLGATGEGVRHRLIVPPPTTPPDPEADRPRCVAPSGP